MPPEPGQPALPVVLPHCWLAPPLQVHRMIAVPLVVPPLPASRQSPDRTLTMVPLLLRFHCWLVPLLQSQMTT